MSLRQSECESVVYLWTGLDSALLRLAFLVTVLPERTVPVHVHLRVRVGVSARVYVTGYSCVCARIPSVSLSPRVQQPCVRVRVLVCVAVTL